MEISILETKMLKSPGESYSVFFLDRRFSRCNYLTLIIWNYADSTAFKKHNKHTRILNDTRIRTELSPLRKFEYP